VALLLFVFCEMEKRRQGKRRERKKENQNPSLISFTQAMFWTDSKTK